MIRSEGCQGQCDPGAATICIVCDQSLNVRKKNRKISVTKFACLSFYVSTFKNMLIREPMQKVRAAIPRLISVISKNLFLKEMSLAKET